MVGSSTQLSLSLGSEKGLSGGLCRLGLLWVQLSHSQYLLLLGGPEQMSEARRGGNQNHLCGKVWWHPPVIPATQELEEDCKFRASRGNLARPYLKRKDKKD